MELVVCLFSYILFNSIFLIFYNVKKDNSPVHFFLQSMGNTPRYLRCLQCLSTKAYPIFEDATYSTCQLTEGLLLVGLTLALSFANILVSLGLE